MEQPTKEEVEKLSIYIREEDGHFAWRQDVLNLCDAYLALRDELKEIDLLYRGLERMSATDKRTIQQLNAENQALKAQVAALEWSIRNPPIIGGGDNFPPQVSSGANAKQIQLYGAVLYGDPKKGEPLPWWKDTCDK